MDMIEEFSRKKFDIYARVYEGVDITTLNGVPSPPSPLSKKTLINLTPNTEGFLNFSLDYEAAKKIYQYVFEHKFSGVTLQVIPAEYREVKIDKEEARKIAKNYFATKFPTEGEIHPFLHPPGGEYPMFRDFGFLPKDETLHQKGEVPAYFVRIDKVDGHVWSVKEWECYLHLWEPNPELNIAAITLFEGDENEQLRSLETLVLMNNEKSQEAIQYFLQFKKNVISPQVKEAAEKALQNFESTL